MKTSNKLLIGLFTVLVISMIIGTITLKSRLNDQVKIENPTDSILHPDSVSGDSATIRINIQ